MACSGLASSLRTGSSERSTSCCTSSARSFEERGVSLAPRQRIDVRPQLFKPLRMQFAECPKIKSHAFGKCTGSIQNFLAGVAHERLGAFPVSRQNVRESPQPRRKSNQLCPYRCTRSFGRSHYLPPQLWAFKISSPARQETEWILMTVDTMIRPIESERSHICDTMVFRMSGAA